MLCLIRASTPVGDRTAPTPSRIKKRSLGDDERSTSSRDEEVGSGVHILKNCGKLFLMMGLGFEAILPIFNTFLSLSACFLYPINIKLAEPIRPKFGVGPHAAPWKVNGHSEFKYVILKYFYFKLFNYVKFCVGTHMNP